MPVALVTGASSGIGYALAQALLQKGFTVVGGARNLSPMQPLKDKFPHTFLPYFLDVTDFESCQKIVDESVKRFGGLDWLINNAGISMRALFSQAKLEVLRQVMEVNFWGTVHCTKAALPHIIARKGVIIGISSIAGYRGLPGRSGYSASKFAMHGFLESLRVELMPAGVHILIVAPGFVRSAIRERALNAHGEPQAESPLPENRLMSAEKVAQLIIQAAQKRKKYLILSSQGWLTVWLGRFFPSWMDKKIFTFFAQEPDSPLRDIAAK